MSIKKVAFTMMETMLALSVIGIFTAVLITALYKDKSREVQTNKTVTITIFNNLDRIYEDILAYKCNNKHSIANLEDINNDKTINSKDIATYFISAYTGEIASSCNELKKPSDFKLLTDTTCVDLAPNAFVAISLDKTCKTSVVANEATGQTNKSKANTCGYMAYSIKNSKGVLGEDFFVYAIEKRTHNKKTIKK